MIKQWWWSNLKCQQFIHSYACICTIKTTTILFDQKYHIIYTSTFKWLKTVNKFVITEYIFSVLHLIKNNKYTWTHSNKIWKKN